MALKERKSPFFVFHGEEREAAGRLLQAASGERRRRRPVEGAISNPASKSLDRGAIRHEKNVRGARYVNVEPLRP